VLGKVTAAIRRAGGSINACRLTGRVRAPRITEAMKLAAAHGIAGAVADDELDEDYIIPSVFDREAASAAAGAVAEVAERPEPHGEPGQATMERAAVAP
jgi:malic enzyme